MENFMLYEELGSGSSSVVYKGRRKGSLSYVAIVRADKAKRPEITNHVRLSHALYHQNIVRFHEWYETSNHIWLVVELCTGGSVESVIDQGGCLSEDVVRVFGWDLVKGLKHIHESGIIFSDLKPAKILLDGSGTLKFGNFCLSKVEGETLESFFYLLFTSEEADGTENFDKMRKRLQGKPPFYSDSCTELSEMIMYQEPPPPRQTGGPPSEEFQKLIKALLIKNPEKRMDWPELLGHPFWIPVLKEEDDVEELEEKDQEEDQEETDCCEAIGTASLSSCANSRRSCISSDSLDQNPVPQASTGTDIPSRVKHLLHSDSDLTVTPIMDNPKILKSPPVRFDPKTLCVPAYSVEKLHSLSGEGWTVFLLQLCSSLEEPNPSTPPLSATAARSKLNLLCYLCCVAGHKVIANKLINSTLAVSTLSDLLRDNLRNSKVKHFLLPPLGEFLYLIASQEEKRGSPEGLWFVPAAAYTGLMRSLREGDDSIVHHIAAKTIENISTTVSGSSHHLFTTEIGSALWYQFTHSTVEAVRVTAVSSLSRLTRVVPAVFLAVIDTCGPAAILEGVGGAGARVQQHLLTAMATALVTSRIQTHHVTQTKVIRSQIVTEEFLAQIGLLLDYVTSIESSETNLASAVVEWSVFVLRVLSELSLALLVQDGDVPDEDVRTEERKERGEEGGRAPEERDEGISSSKILALITESLLPRYESLLQAAEPIPLYALKLLVSVTEHSTKICRLIKHSRILPTVFQLIMANRSNVTSGMVQNAVALLCNLTEGTVMDLEPLHHQGLIEVVVNTLSEAAVVPPDGDGHAMRKIGHLVLQALLELLHNILKQTSQFVRAALKLSTENQEVWEESIQCLSLLVQLYSGEGHDCLSPSCLQILSHTLRTHMQTVPLRIQRTTLRILKRLVETTDRSDWLECPEGAELAGQLQDITASNRCHGDVVLLAAEILQEISGS
ncbi:hypothetical protein F2P81_001661 [Scophthalmus maximus]|uniref:Protein kinase domain-containing protein n=1 Tax=Scophthalmus maximus TaxID=52904 RepID=A0A6A4TST5_SCOMX|nr:hypothetical protein F2P81_001661 [Scophthalmus maximus]